MSQSLLAGIEMAPRDPILGVTEAYNTDTNPNKVNLGVGVYYDDNGKVPVLECVRRVEQKLAESPLPRNYLPIDGIQAYDRAVLSWGVWIGSLPRCISQPNLGFSHSAGHWRHFVIGPA